MEHQQHRTGLLHSMNDINDNNEDDDDDDDDGECVYEESSNKTPCNNRNIPLCSKPIKLNKMIHLKTKYCRRVYRILYEVSSCVHYK